MLSYQERVKAMEIALDHVANRYIEKCIRQAPNDQDALVVAKRECRWFGHYGPDLYVRGHDKGLEVETKGGCREIIPWHYLVDYIRKPQQEVLW